MDDQTVTKRVQYWSIILVVVVKTEKQRIGGISGRTPMLSRDRQKTKKCDEPAVACCPQRQAGYEAELMQSMIENDESRWLRCQDEREMRSPGIPKPLGYGCARTPVDAVQVQSCDKKVVRS